MRRAGSRSELTIVGTARAPWDDEAFRAPRRRRLAEHAADVPGEHRDALTESLRYRQIDVTDADDVAAVIRLAGQGPVAAYLALPPGLVPCDGHRARRRGVAAGSRIALEKPFGESLEDAVALNELLARAAGDAGEQAVFRVDHVLGMATVQNLLALRRHDPVLAAVWDAEHIERVEVLWEEDLALEGRAGYYDGTGALKDVMQNHMLQVLCLLAMEPPAGAGERELRDAKVAVLRAARPPGPDGSPAARGAPATAPGASATARCPRTSTRRASIPTAAPRPSPRSCSSSTPPAGAARASCCAPARRSRARRKEAVVRFRAIEPDGVPACLRIGIDGPLRRRPATHRSGADRP